MTFWDDIAASGSAPDNMCHLSVSDCLSHLSPIIKSNPPRILDLGCGIGRLTFPLQELVYPSVVMGEDSCQGMLDIAATSLSRFPCYPYPTFHVNDGSTLYHHEFEAAFSIGMFQHVPDSTMSNYIDQVSAALTDDGLFIFQYVHSGEPGPLSFPRDDELVSGWLIDAGFDYVMTHEEGWSWVTATRS